MILSNPFICAIMLLCCNFLAAQEYLGLGIHTAPPIRIDNCCNSYVEVKPILSPAYSFTFKKIWKNRKEKTWHYEIGITTIGLGVNVKNYFNDTISVWDEFKLTHFGFPSILFGVGRIYPIRTKGLNHDLSFGLEGSYRLAHELQLLNSENFSLARANMDITFPFFLRFNGGYGVHIKFLRNIPFYLQAYVNASFQDIARSPQYLRDPSTGFINEAGKYKLNNSEIGLKLFANTDINYNKHKWVKKEKTSRNKELVGYRISFEGQTYIPPTTKYFIPKVDSFSLNGVKITFTYQAGIKTEILHPRNPNWATIFGVGLGITYISNQFKAIPSFTRTGWDIDLARGTGIGIHLIPNLGLAYKHPIGNKHFQHSISATIVIPTTKESRQIFVYDGIDPTLPPHLWKNILLADVNHKYGRSSTLLGIEYQPEFLVHADERFFYGIGMVFNYSSGVIAQGRATVDNGRTQYYGGIIQNFSKIGLTLRIGWNSSPRN